MAEFRGGRCRTVGLLYHTAVTISAPLFTIERSVPLVTFDVSIRTFRFGGEPYTPLAPVHVVRNEKERLEERNARGRERLNFTVRGSET